MEHELDLDGDLRGFEADHSCERLAVGGAEEVDGRAFHLRKVEKRPGITTVLDGAGFGQVEAAQVELGRFESDERGVEQCEVRRRRMRVGVAGPYELRPPQCLP